MTTTVSRIAMAIPDIIHSLADPLFISVLGSIIVFMLVSHFIEETFSKIIKIIIFIILGIFVLVFAYRLLF